MSTDLRSQTFVSTAWLHQHLDAPDLRIVDIRGSVRPATDPPPHYQSHRAAYDEAHLPGAVFVDWITDITADGPADMRLAPPDSFAALMGQLGIGPETYVVAYDESNGMFGARLWWALKHYGHDAAAVLDGGWAKWTAENRPVSTEPVTVTPTTFNAQPIPALYRDGDQVQTLLGSDAVLVDVRSPEEYRGEAARSGVTGHIPGAVNTPRKSLLGADETLLPIGVLRDAFAAHGLNPDQPPEEVVFYCNSGVSASYGLLAYRAAGFSGGAVYDGSWNDWTRSGTRPTE